MLFKLELSVDLHTGFLDKKPLLSLMSIESSSGSEEGRGGQQMMPKLLNKAFSMKATNLNLENVIKNPMALVYNIQTRYVAASVVTDALTDN